MHVFYFFVMSEQRPDLSTFALIHFYPKIKTVIVERIILNNEWLLTGTFRHPQERNFHIFYTLLYGLAPQEKERVGLRTPEDYAFIRNSNALPVEEREETDGRGIIKLQNALDSIALYDSSQYR